MKVIKRDGSTVDFDKSKIVRAISRANESVDFEDRVDDAQINAIVDDIASRHRRRVLVEDIQDMVEEKLMEIQKYQLMKSYILPLRACAYPQGEHHGRKHTCPH